MINKNDKCAINDEDLNALNLYMKEISHIPLLKEQEEKILLLSLQSGNKEAFDKLIKSNLRLVINISKKYINKELPLEDIIQEGNLGLIYASYHYDMSKDVKFSTYATHWIEKYIKMAIIKNNNIHQNPKIYYKISKLKSLYKELCMILERKPSLEELSNYTNIKKEYIEKVFSYNYEVESLNTPIKIDSNEVFQDFIIDYSKSIEDIIIDKEFKEFIYYILFKSNILNEEEQFIFKNRFGFNNKIMSYDEIGEKLNITREAVRQKIVKVIIRLLKIYGEKLIEFSDNPIDARKVVDEATNGYFKIYSFKAKNRRKTINKS